MPQSSDNTRSSGKRRKDFGDLGPAPAETGRQELEAPGAHVLQTLASVAPVGILRADPRRYCIYVNQQWCEMSGLTPEQSIRTGWLRAFHPEDRHRVFTEWEEAVRENRPYRSEYRFRRPNGEVIWIYGQAVAEYDDDGQVIGYIGTTTDITEHKQLQEQLSQTQKMEAVGRLAGGIAHDFNNLLTVITGYTTLLQDGMSPNHPARRKMEAIGQAAEQAASLTGQLLAFGKHQAGVPRVINFNPVVRGMDAVLQSIAGESIEFEARLTDPLSNVEIDASELEHLILNFVTNACDAMPSGGHLLLETSDAVMEQPYTDGRARLDRGRYVELAVTDTGVGIDPGMQAHIFEPFFSTKSDGRRGAGLGLAASYATVMQSGGAIVFKSTPEKGSRFAVYLPVVDKPTSPEVVAAATKTSSLDATVMVVEDNDSLRTLVTEILEGKGCRVQSAAGPLEALEQLGKRMPDLILTDVIMPVMNGPEMVDKMLARAPELKVLYMSGYTSDALEGRASIRHADILQKPFSPNQLLRKVTDALR